MFLFNQIYHFVCFAAWILITLKNKLYIGQTDFLKRIRRINVTGILTGRGKGVASRTAKVGFILALTLGIGGGVVLVFVVILVCVCRRTRRKKKDTGLVYNYYYNCDVIRENPTYGRYFWENTAYGRLLLLSFISLQFWRVHAYKSYKSNTNI